MAFFEFLASLGEALNSTLNLFIKPVGGQGTGNISPSPKAGLPQNPGTSNAGVIVQDSDGSLRTRAGAFTTRVNFRDDFTGTSLNTALTGTLTFTAGSVSVTGTGTTFTTQLTRDLYIKLNTDTEAAWTKVRRVITDTSLELDQGYLGTTGGPAASSSTRWPTTTGTGGSFSVASSLVNVLSGTTSGAKTFISHGLDYALFRIDFVSLNISQRIANQAGFAGVFDNVSSPTQQAAFIFDGTSNTVVRCRSSFTATATDIQETVATLPYGLTSNLTTVNYSLEITPNSVNFYANGTIIAIHSFHTPEQFTVMNVAVGMNNTGAPASTTTIQTDMAVSRSYDQVDTNAAPPEPEMHSVTGLLNSSATTADQVIVSFTVPTGKILYITGWMVSGNASGVSGSPFKVGKNTVTTEPAAPGTEDANILYAFFMQDNANGPNPIAMQYAVPRRFAFAADVVKITVTPSAATATAWRATIEFILKDAMTR